MIHLRGVHRLLLLILPLSASCLAARGALADSAPSTPVSTVLPSTRLSGLAERRAVLSAIEVGRDRLLEVSARLDRAGTGSEREELARQVRATKLAIRAEVLRIEAEFARNRGDAAAALAFDAARMNLLKGREPVGPAGAQPAEKALKPAVLGNGDVEVVLPPVGANGNLADVSSRASNQEQGERIRDGLSKDAYLYSPPSHAFDAAILPASGAVTENLNAQITLPRWDAPLVPRNMPGAMIDATQVTAILDGNAPTTYVSWNVMHEGSTTLPAWAGVVYLDETLVMTVMDVAAGNPPGDYLTLDDGPFTIRGGRHTLTSSADPSDLIAETDETDNLWMGQWVWSPLVLTREVPIEHVDPPQSGFMPIVDSDGFQFTRNPSFAWVVSCAPRAVFSDYELIVYDDYVGSTSGFSNQIKFSFAAENRTDFVVGHYALTPQTVYPAVFNLFGSGAGPPFEVEGTDASFRNGPPDPNQGAQFPAQVMNANRLADVYEAYMQTGTTYYLTMRRTAGSESMRFEAFSATPGTIAARGQGTASSTTSEAIETLAYTPTTTGWHPIVVYRDRGTNADQPVAYDFGWALGGFVDVPDLDSGPAKLTFSRPEPNPAHGSTRFEFTLTHDGRASLDLFDLGGRRISSLVDAPMTAGRHALTWDLRRMDGSPVGAGVYWARFQAEGRTMTRRVVVTR
jgi:hypothetical protein